MKYSKNRWLKAQDIVIKRCRDKSYGSTPIDDDGVNGCPFCPLADPKGGVCGRCIYPKATGKFCNNAPGWYDEERAKWHETVFRPLIEAIPDNDPFFRKS